MGNRITRAYEWEERYSGAVTDASGAVVTCVYRVATPTAGEDVVRFRSTFTSP